MATKVIMPALGMSQDTGTVVRWLKAEGEQIAQGETLAQIETDKATVDLEAPASGLLANLAIVGEAIPIGQPIALILAEGEVASAQPLPSATPPAEPKSAVLLDSTGQSGPACLPDSAGPLRSAESPPQGHVIPGNEIPPGLVGPPPLRGPASPHETSSPPPAQKASPLASRIAAGHNLDLSAIQSSGRRIQKADVLNHLQGASQARVVSTATGGMPPADPGGAEDGRRGRPAQSAARQTGATTAILPASPKARRLAAERGIDLAALKGSGPDGAVLVGDVLTMPAAVAPPLREPEAPDLVGSPIIAGSLGSIGSPPLRGPMLEAARESEQSGSTVSTIWRVMAERTTQSWTSVPHFSLMREVNASRLVAWRAQIQQRSAVEISYTDLLVKVAAAALRLHPRLNASWINGRITMHDEVNIGLAVAIEDGLVVPVMHQADTLTLREIAGRRIEVVALAHSHTLRPQDLQGGTFTISNLGMYGVDAFNAIINAPQAAILAVGRIAERVVPVQGQPAIQPMLVLNLSCDHRVVDGARGAQFLTTLAELLEEPLGIVF